METKKSGQYFLTADLGKFIYSWFIVGFHFYLGTSLRFPGGRFGVEYFVLVAGVFFFRSIGRAEQAPPRNTSAGGSCGFSPGP